MSTSTSKNATGTLKKPGRYELKRTFDGGGRPGSIHRASDEEAGCEVFVKLLRPVDSGSQAGEAEFEQGVKQLQVLEHPNIASVHDYGHFHGMAYLATDEPAEFTLADYIDERGALDLPAFVAIFADILDGLEAAHRHGLIHGDIGASEILLASDGDTIERAVLFGFSFPRLQEEDSQEGNRQTAHADALGAVAPERVVGREFDERIDLYALGLAAYYALTTRRPFTGGNRGVIFQHIHQSPPPLEGELADDTDIPDAIVEFVHGLLSKEPDERPAGAAEARSRLKSAVGDEQFREYVDRRDLAALEDSRTEESSGERDSLPHDVRAALPGDVREVLDTDEGDAPAGSTDASDRATLRVGWKWLLAAGGLVCALLGVALAALIVEVGGDGASERSEIDVEALRQKLAAATKEDRRRRLREILKRSSDAIESGNLQTARVLLELVGARVGRYPEMKGRVESMRQRVKVAAALQEARKLEKRQKIGKAIKNYHEVLSIAPDNETASSHLEKLKSSVALKLKSNVRGTVYIDGVPVGKTPFSKLIPADETTVEVRRPGYRNWSKRIAPEGGTRLKLSARLRGAGGGGAAAGGGRGGKKSDSKSSGGSSDDNSLMEMNID